MTADAVIALLFFQQIIAPLRMHTTTTRPNASRFLPSSPLACSLHPISTPACLFQEEAERGLPHCCCTLHTRPRVACCQGQQPEQPSGHLLSDICTSQFTKHVVSVCVCVCARVCACARVCLCVHVSLRFPRSSTRKRLLMTWQVCMFTTAGHVQ